LIQAAKAKEEAAKIAKAELKKQEKAAADKMGAKAARSEARKKRNAERAVRRDQKVEKQNLKVRMHPLLLRFLFRFCFQSRARMHFVALKPSRCLLLSLSSHFAVPFRPKLKSPLKKPSNSAS